MVSHAKPFPVLVRSARLEPMANHSDRDLVSGPESGPISGRTPSRRTVLAGGVASVALAPLPLTAGPVGRAWPVAGGCVTLSFDVASGAKTDGALAVCTPLS